MAPQKHILVLRFSSMGDVAMTVQVIKALLNQNAEVSITFVSRPGFSDFFADIPRLTYIPVDLSITYKGFAGILKLYQELKSSAVYDAVADLHDNLRTKVLRNMFKLSGTPFVSIDKGRAEKKRLTRFPNKMLKPLKRTTERYADVFRKLGYPLNLNYQLVKEPSVLTDKIMAVTGLKTNAWVGITPFAQYKGKILPAEKMDEVIRLLGGYDVKVFLFGGTPLDQEMCMQWEQKHSHVVSVVRRLSIKQELVLINQLNVMLSMDSAGMHLASLRGTPVVSVWGATHHYAGFLGYGQSEDNIVADNIECRPCSVYGNKPCFRKDYACLYNLEPKVIVNNLLKFV